MVRSPDCLSASLCDPSDRELLFIIGGRDLPNVAKDVQLMARKFQLARIVVIGDRIDTASVILALEAGARGYLGDNMSPDALLKSLELVMLDETVLPAEFAKSLSNELAQHQQALATLSSRTSEIEIKIHRVPALSNRERAILKMLALGSSNKVIAYDLSITEATVKVHVKSILRKIHASNRTQAATWARTNQPTRPTHPSSPCRYLRIPRPTAESHSILARRPFMAGYRCAG